MASHNVDDLLNANLAKSNDDSSKEIESQSSPAKEESVEDREEERLNYLEQFRRDKKESLGEKDEKPKAEGKLEAVSKEDKAPESKSEKPSESTDLKTSESSDETTEVTEDEYGNKVSSKKVYTEEQVNAMVRDRLARERQERSQQQHPQEQVAKAAENFEADPNSDESWETQLSGFVRNEVQRMNKEQQQRTLQAQAQRDHAEFEARFTTGMSKYSDFVDIVSKTPVTDDMVKATRSMKDPAAFVYAASKMHAKEIERISQLSDPYQVAAEIGRLEERMKRQRNTSSAPKPASKITSDMSDKYTGKVSVDSLILNDAKRKLRRK